MQKKVLFGSQIYICHAQNSNEFLRFIYTLREETYAN